MGQYSSFLFAEPSFTEGVARIIDIGNTLPEYNYAASEEEADARAIYADWCAVGQSIKRATREYGKRLRRQKVNRNQTCGEQAGVKKTR